MKRIVVMIVAAVIASACTKYNYNDTGTVGTKYAGNMYQYLQSGSYNWDSIRKIIDRAELEEVFKSDNITFMGVTNHSVRKWLMVGGGGFDTYNYKCVADISKPICRAIVLAHIVEGKMMRDQIERATFDDKGNASGGGRHVTSRGGNKLWLWTKQSPYMGVPGIGPVDIYMTAMGPNGTTQISKNRVASGDIQPTNGVVHALEYSYNIENIGPLVD